AQTQRLERLDRLRPDHLSIAYDGLTPLVRLLHGRHRLARILLRWRRGVLVHHLVRAHEALHQLHDDRPIRRGKQRADVERDLVAELVDAVVGDAVLHDVLERALRLVGDGRPAVIVQNGELTGGRVAERRRDQPGNGARAVVQGRASAVATDHVDRLDQVSQAARLLGDDVATELDDRRDLGGGRVARLARANLTDEGDLAGGFDGYRRDVALFDVVHAWQQIHAEHEGEQQRRNHTHHDCKRHPRPGTGAGRRR